jgi:uncharacterized membrane protein
LVLSLSIRSRIAFFLSHLALSALLAACVAGIVFAAWFPEHFRMLAGGQRLFWTVVAVDVVCGPLLTLILYKPTKTKLALAVDITLIAAIQLAALGYGLYSLASARPIAVVFEVDRFRVVSHADIPEADLLHLPSWAARWSLRPPRTVGLKMPMTVDERVQSFDAALQGVEIGQRPQYWQDYQLAAAAVRARAQHIKILQQARADQAGLIDRAIKQALNDQQIGETQNSEELMWAPLVTRSTLEWVVILDPVTLRIRAYAPLDGFL